MQKNKVIFKNNEGPNESHGFYEDDYHDETQQSRGGTGHGLQRKTKQATKKIKEDGEDEGKGRMLKPSEIKEICERN